MTNLDQGKSRQGTTTSVLFPTLPSLSQQPMRTQLYQEEGAHDLLVLQFRATHENWFRVLKTGVPIHFTWSQSPFKNNWIGYVSYVSKQVSGQTEQIMEVHCVGASFPLKERVSEVFENSTITQAVETIVSKFGFKFIGDPHPLVFEQLVIAGHSYWEWIQEQAKRIGYGVLVDGMSFIFKPLDKLIDYRITSVPVFSMMGKGVSGGVMYNDRTLDSFVVLNGEYVENPHALRTVKAVGGVDPITGTTFYSAKSPKDVGINLRQSVSDVLFSEIRAEQVAHSHQAAESLSEGAAHNGRLNMPAKVKGQGDPRLKVFAPVVIRGTGDLTDGYWVAKKIKHMFSRNGNYQVELTISTDGSGLTNRTSQRQDTGTVVGVVNLTDALNSTGIAGNTAVNEAYKLSGNLGIQTEYNQGFLRTPNRWMYSPISSRGLV